jgi:hypothetical protein
MNKIAVIVTGNTRGFYSKWIDYVLPILKNIENSELVLFFQLWDNNNVPHIISKNKFVIDNIGFETESITNKMLNHENIETLSQVSVYEEIQSIIKEDMTLHNSKYNNMFQNGKLELDYAEYVDLCNYYSQPYSWKYMYDEILNYEIKNCISFDYILKIRYDCFFTDEVSKIIKDFSTHGSDIMTPGQSLWIGNKTSELNDNIIKNGICDQWFVIKKSLKTDIIFKNIMKQMFKTNHQNISFFGKRLVFENCFYVSLVSLNALLSTKHYPFILMRNHEFNETYEKFIKYNILPEYSHAPSVIMNQSIFKNLK